jgi:hypothetical protein
MRLTMRRTLFFSALAAATVFLSAGSASAGPVPAWCARTNLSPSFGDCSYYTYDQCMAFLRGIGGDCIRNGFASAPPPRRRGASYYPY